MKTGKYYNQGDLPWSVEVPDNGACGGHWTRVARFSDEASAWEYGRRFSSARVACREVVIGVRTGGLPGSNHWEPPTKKGSD